jgi:hypothetical protein
MIMCREYKEGVSTVKRSGAVRSKGILGSNKTILRGIPEKEESCGTEKDNIRF